MAKKVAVEESLSDLKEALTRKGYEVVAPGRTDNVMAMVVTGMDNNLMNMESIAINAPVIDASGFTTEQILSRLSELS
ncbi:hypothetical protein DCCM_4162 [Desulfocucumis palustris]|uniref:YkuS family protein n=1 Tax=Desulfocucumis palustris TaxID=1898651 RepID=A0A2L2XM69_9FIRM|nr:YkuS family protein [Desulfocucumis palustris]GBF35041.1 hypothetical protein DCCM_4162 [Desulfocucumis palustris]